MRRVRKGVVRRAMSIIKRMLFLVLMSMVCPFVACHVNIKINCTPTKFVINPCPLGHECIDKDNGSGRALTMGMEWDWATSTIGGGSSRILGVG